jgi:hypothetical protein
MYLSPSWQNCRCSNYLSVRRDADACTFKHNVLAVILQARNTRTRPILTHCHDECKIKNDTKEKGGGLLSGVSTKYMNKCCNEQMKYCHKYLSELILMSNYTLSFKFNICLKSTDCKMVLIYKRS